jgi:hypothetical protein
MKIEAPSSNVAARSLNFHAPNPNFQEKRWKVEPRRLKVREKSSEAEPILIPRLRKAALVGAEPAEVVVEGRAEAFGQFDLDLTFGADGPDERDGD